ncbi:MAG: YlxR family protein, partial [Clostridia bacterium]|nr:YlxR family protein [Clostridia bacterium]
MKDKKVPMRMCVSCRQMMPKSSLLRIVHTPEGDLKIDFKGKQNGRGAYICDS